MGEQQVGSMVSRPVGRDPRLVHQLRLSSLRLHSSANPSESGGLGRAVRGWFRVNGGCGDQCEQQVGLMVWRPAGRDPRLQQFLRLSVTRLCSSPNPSESGGKG